ncbi:MAG: Unknown protein [uncultured Campylobacterales bacterium]|uniref:Uncharacterized protein n=1 Tax=uncultured Campylobacterales bacterium TaxID=352960 RepID=A0A6S6T1L4_9BACT|nr:MAG: Unknown protein [uncultured Campylobacterales bacterium]
MPFLSVVLISGLVGITILLIAGFIFLYNQESAPIQYSFTNEDFKKIEKFNSKTLSKFQIKIIKLWNNFWVTMFPYIVFGLGLFLFENKIIAIIICLYLLVVNLCITIMSIFFLEYIQTKGIRTIYISKKVNPTLYFIGRILYIIFTLFLFLAATWMIIYNFS